MLSTLISTFSSNLTFLEAPLEEPSLGIFGDFTPAESCFFTGEVGLKFNPSFILAELVDTPLSFGDLKSLRDSS